MPPRRQKPLPPVEEAPEFREKVLANYAGPPIRCRRCGVLIPGGHYCPKAGMQMLFYRGVPRAKNND